MLRAEQLHVFWLPAVRNLSLLFPLWHLSQLLSLWHLPVLRSLRLLLGPQLPILYSRPRGGVHIGADSGSWPSQLYPAPRRRPPLRQLRSAQVLPAIAIGRQDLNREIVPNPTKAVATTWPYGQAEGP